MPVDTLVTNVRRIAVKHVDVWFAWTDGFDDMARRRFETVLSREERARRDRFVLERDRCDFVVAHGLTRFALSHCGPLPPAEWQFEVNGRGKPFVISRQSRAPSLAMNLSHTRGLVACAVGRGIRLGVDVENVGRAPDAREIALHHFAPSEVQMLEASEPARYAFRFAELWTLKEAYIKGIGVGLECPLSAFAMRYEADDDVALAGWGHEDSWKFLLVAPSPTTRLALAMSGEHAGQPHEVTLHNPHAPMYGPLVPIRWSRGVTVRFDNEQPALLPTH